MKKLVFTLLSVFLFANLVNILYSQELTPKQIFKKCEGAVVVVLALDTLNNEIGQGSGVVINEKGWIVTNYHNYKCDKYNAAKLVIKHKNVKIEYTDIIGFDISRDLLILKFENKNYDLPSLKIGNSDKLEVGDPLYTIGSPQGLENSLYSGLVSGIGRELSIVKYPAIQMSCIIDHGSSGGAVINAYGELVGISSWQKNNLFFAIPINDIFEVNISSYGDEWGEKFIDCFNLGYKACNENKFEDAINYYTKYLKEYSSNEFAYTNRGSAYAELKRYAEAITDYSKAIQLKPNFALAYYGRGLTYHNLKRYDEAIADYIKAIQCKPNFVDAYNNRGVTYFKLQKYDKALADYRKAIDLNPDYAEAYGNRGNIYSKLLKYDEAIADYTKVIQLNPDLAEGYNNRGLAYKNLKQYDTAIADYNKAINLNSDFVDAFHNRGTTYDNLKKYDEAISDYTKAIQLNPNLVEAYNNRGNTYYRLQKYSKAINDWEKAIELNSEYKNKLQKLIDEAKEKLKKE